METSRYKIAVGRSRLDTTWKNTELEWRLFTSRLSKVKRTSETVNEYAAMSKDEKGRAKDIGGFVGGALVSDGRRKAETLSDRCMITLDIDFGRDDTIEAIREALLEYTWCLYSTHGHTPEKPRFRLVIPLSRTITPDEYVPLARRVASDIDIDLFDDSTYKAERLMYWPSCPKDGDFIFEEGKGMTMDADTILAHYTDWRNVAEWPRSSREEKLLSSSGRKAEDPATKSGAVGDFCRAYTIGEAIAAYIPEVYEPTNREDRYTYKAGSTAAGAVVYDDKWIYSNHGSDPASQRLLNAFDLVRIHMFAERDATAKEGTPFNRFPSFSAMVELVDKDERVRANRLTERLRTAGEDFGAVVNDDAAMTELSKLDRSKNGKIQSSPKNIALILRNDPRISGTAKVDELAHTIRITRDLPWRGLDKGPWWSNADNDALVTWFSENYDIEHRTNITGTFNDIASRISFHPVREYFKSLPPWDGVPRLDTLIIDYLGADDNALTRAFTRKHFVAAVKRILAPGCKYDTVLTFVGPEGVGKSSLIKILAGDWLNDSFSCGTIGDKEAMESMLGTWLIEMAELKDVKKSSVEAVKAFISKQEDRFRPAYGRVSETYPRQCVFFATTNEVAFLRGDTGNRRWWPVEVGRKRALRNVWNDLPGVKDQIWAEALRYYNAGESVFLSHDEETQARARQNAYNEVMADSLTGVVEVFVKAPLPLDWWGTTKQRRTEYFRSYYQVTPYPESGVIRRDTICAQEVLNECPGIQADGRVTSQRLTPIFTRLGFACMDGGEATNAAYLKDGSWRGDPVGYGKQRRFRIPAGFYDEERADGAVTSNNSTI